MVDEYLDEREQAEQLRQWFKENWLWLVTGVALGLGGLYGWRGWNDYLDGKSQDAGQRFGAMLQALERSDRPAGEQIAAEILAKYGSTPYADQTELVLARLDVEAREYDKAATRLGKVMEESGDPELALVSRIRLAAYAWLRHGPVRIRGASAEPDAGQARCKDDRVRVHGVRAPCSVYVETSPGRRRFPGRAAGLENLPGLHQLWV